MLQQRRCDSAEGEIGPRSSTLRELVPVKVCLPAINVADEMRVCNSPYPVSFYGVYQSRTGIVVICTKYMGVGWAISSIHDFIF